MQDPDRLAGLRKAKLLALARSRWDVAADAPASNFPTGASLSCPESSTTWVLIEEQGRDRLGAALAVALRARSTVLHVIVATGADAAILARRATLVDFDVTVWTIVGTDIVRADPAPAARDEPPAPEAELYRPILEEAGLDPVVEGGELLGEFLGLEAARVVKNEDGTTRVEAGVGRFDREAGSMVRAGMPETEALHVVVDLISPLRRTDAERHPVNQLVQERWLRAVLVRHPELVGAAELRVVGSAVPRNNLTEAGIASAVGRGEDGEPVMVSCSVGVYLDLVPAAADDRLTHAPNARLLLVVPERDDAPITRELANLLPNSAVVTVPDDWASTDLDIR